MAERAERDQLIAAGARGTQKTIEHRDDEITPSEQVGLEVIVVFEGRPPFFIHGGDFLMVPR